MAVLKNTKHERFAQLRASGLCADDAYVQAGYARSTSNAARLSAFEPIRNRIEEILSAAAEKVAVSRAQVLEELCKIAFADIRKAIEWHGCTTVTENADDSGKVVTHAFANQVLLKDSDKIDDATAAAISEVRQSPTGGLSLKLHDKQAALVSIGKDLGMFKERIEHTGKDGGPIEHDVTGARDELIRRISRTVARADHAGDPSKLN